MLTCQYGTHRLFDIQALRAHVDRRAEISEARVSPRIGVAPDGVLFIHRVKRVLTDDDKHESTGAFSGKIKSSISSSHFNSDSKIHNIVRCNYNN